MDNYPSNKFIAKFEAAFLLTDPEEEFVHGLRRSLVEHTEKSTSKSVGNGKLVQKAPFPMIFPRKTWVVIGLVLLVLVTAFIFRQPVLAAASRLFGYGYFPPVGFVQLDTARILNNPVKQEHAGNSLTVVRGLATPEHTILWLEYSDITQPADGAWLETPIAEHIVLSSWNWDPNQPNTKGIRLEFPPLPAGDTQTTLALPEGWRLPLTWIPASQSALSNVSIVLYGEPSTASTQATATSSEICDEHHDLKFCLLAATTTVENTSVLVKVQSANSKITPGDPYQGLVWSTATDPVTLRDEQGVVYPMTGQQGDNLTFPIIAAREQKVTLTIPAVLATVAIPEQIIRVDMGDNPQPDQVISLNADIQVLGTTVHFRKATFVGDGVNSLRLTLIAEPVETKDGITPLMLQMSKPDRVDDLYGSGNLDGSKALFVELIRPQGKINGVLELPIVEATVILSGPFEFTFSLSQMTPQPSPTPAVVNPDTFSPAPTSTPLALDTYRFTGILPKTGDLLFTVINGETTSLYFSNPSNPSEIKQIATLPGQVYQVYLHPDGLGIDYLAGEQKIDNDTSYYRGAQLFTLQFADPAPRLLFTFPTGGDSVIGTEYVANWSFDGKLMAYQYYNSQQKPGEPFWKLGWMNMACRESGNCQGQEIQFPHGLDLYDPQFSPQGYSLMLEGSNSASGSGADDIFLINFNQDGIPGNVVNLSNTDQINERVPHWNPKTGQVVALCPADPSEAKKEICFYDPISGEQQDGAIINLYNPQDYQVFPQGDQGIVMNINPNAGGKGTLELLLLNFDGTVGPVLAGSRWFDGFNLSMDGNFLAYSEEGGKQLTLITLQTGASTTVYQCEVVGTISWMGWAK
jgi:hypothetical protein